MIYVLLAHLSMMEVSTEDINYASQLVVNLNKQRNTHGGFSSTQNSSNLLGLMSKKSGVMAQQDPKNWNFVDINQALKIIK
ncbi:hypothetical protein L345_17624, partial [Ophiophagus hannah]